MTDNDFLAYLGTDAAKWAAEFCKIAKDHGHRIDEGWMIGWFANAIESGREAGRDGALEAAQRVIERVVKRTL